MDEILLANFMVFHDLVARRALRPLDRRRGLGARLLPAREPGAEARRLRVADRLRRLAADARRRRARGVPDRRLQRRDDRAHRALPARARPRRLRRQPRRHRARRASARTCRAIRDWTERALSTSPATSPASTRPSFADREALRAELGYRDDEQVCIVTVGGSGVGGAPAAARDRRVPGGEAAGARRCG